MTREIHHFIDGKTFKGSSGQFGDVWAPWYTLHKILAGLLDWCAHAGLQP